MTPAEFKAWFEGFCEAIDGAPTPDQWAKVVQRVVQMQPFMPAPPAPKPAHDPWPDYRRVLTGSPPGFPPLPRGCSSLTIAHDPNILTWN